MIELQKAVDNSKSLEELFINLGYSKNPNSRTRSKVRELLKELRIEDGAKYFRQKRLKYPPLEEKQCPVCNKMFLPTRRAGKDSTTCSYSCANTYFKSGINHPNHKPDSINAHRVIGFHYHDKKCVVCGEDEIVEIHHMDEDHSNNEPSNLVPLCPTHHRYWHSKLRHKIEHQVMQYINNGP